MGGFTEALDVFGGDTSPPPGSAPLQMTVYKRSEGSPSTTDFSGAFGVFSGKDIPAKTTEAPKREPMSIGGAALTGLKSGLTANFSDEMSGAAAASPLAHSPTGTFNPVDLIAGAGRLAFEGLAGRGEGTAAYEKARDEERARQQQASEEHPIANIAGNVAGALALPIGGAAQAASLPGRMAAGAGLGAGMGAAFGAGEGTDLADRAGRAGTGAVLGAAAGGVAPAILQGAGAVLGHPVAKFNAIRNPDQEAARRVGGAILKDMQDGRPGMGAAELRDAASSGQPTAVIDVGGENTRALARSAANTSPAARAAIDEMAGNRFAEQSGRSADFIRGLVSTPANATRTQEAIDVAERAANKGGYARAYAAGDRPIKSAELDRLTGSPDVVAAMKSAAEKGKSRAIAEGHGAFNPGVKVTDDGRVIFNKGPNGVPTYPNIQFWDYTYRALRDSASSAFRAGRNDEGNTLKTLANHMRSELDNLVPEYGKARGVASEFFQAENALEAGQKFVGMRGPIEEARVAHAKMTPQQKSMFAEGFASELADKISKIVDNRSVTIDRIFKSPDGRARIELALGSQKAEDLQNYMHRENMMDLVRRAMGNSTTARQLTELGFAGGLAGVAGGGVEAAMNGDFSAKTLLSSALIGGATMGHRAINFKIAQRVGEMLASDDPKVLGTALKMVKNNPDARRAMRNAETILEKLSGQGGGAAPPLLPSVAASRADQQQQ